MKHTVKLFTLFIMIIHTQSDTIENTEDENLDMLDNEPTKPVNNEYSETLNGDTSYEDDLEEVKIKNSSAVTFTERLKQLPAKVLLSLLNTGHKVKSGMEKVYEGKLLDGTKQSFGGFFGLFKDGFTNAKDLMNAIRDQL